MNHLVRPLLAALVVALLAACGSGASDDDNPGCTTNADCPGGICVDGTCRYLDGSTETLPEGGADGDADPDVPPPDGADADADPDAPPIDGADADADADGDADGTDGFDYTPEPERCGDGLDNDLDGLVDEDCGCLPGSTQPCYSGPPPAAGVGLCARGTQTCVGSGEFGDWGACEGSILPGIEICDDATDNDCDGAADDGCVCSPDDRRPCYTGAAGTEGVGECRAGSQYCVTLEGGGTEWGECSGQVLPASDYCDGVDNDCDGFADNGCECPPGTTEICYEGPAETRGRGICEDGMRNCVVDPGGLLTTWGPCAGWIGPTSEFCGDGIDNNCDGRTEEGCGCLLGERRPCYTGPAGTEGEGLCRAGSQTCVATSGGGTDWGTCGGSIVPQPDICDGLDNDCNGNPDDGCVCTPFAEEVCYGGPTGTRGRGTCLDGLRECFYEAGATTSEWGPCLGWRGPSASESCDLLDNDCDGTTDEGCVCTVGATRSCYSGPAGTAGRGICRAGSQSCVTLGGGLVGWGACSGEVLPATEVCGDVRDNDCDGTVDEGCLCSPGAGRSCYSGPAGTSGIGICRSGSQTCVTLPGGGADWTTCTGEVLPATEICADAIDNDCDRSVDEGCLCTPGTTRACYTGPASTRSVGECRDGSQICVEVPGSGSSWGTCTGERLPSTDVCGNGRDEDCDGTADDGCTHDPWVTCPSSPITMVARATVTLSASDGDPAGDIVSRRWEVTSGPAGMLYTFGCTTCASTTFRADIAGVYMVRYTVTDSLGRTASCTVEVRVTGLGIRVELVWDIAGDVDLHLLHQSAPSWFSSPYDCYYANMRPSWDAAGTTDDPRLDIDDIPGDGPENINVDGPTTGYTYRVGVHHYRSDGCRSATVRIYCGDIAFTPMATYTRTVCANGGGGSRDMWRVADVRWNGGDSCTVTPLNTVISDTTSRSTR